MFEVFGNRAIGYEVLKSIKRFEGRVTIPKKWVYNFSDTTIRYDLPNKNLSRRSFLSY